MPERPQKERPPQDLWKAVSYYAKYNDCARLLCTITSQHVERHDVLALFGIREGFQQHRLHFVRRLLNHMKEKEQFAILLADLGPSVLLLAAEYSATPAFEDGSQYEERKDCLSGIADLLLDEGIKPDPRDRNGLTPLMKTALPDFALRLLQKGADIWALDHHKRTALMHAKHIEIAKALVNAAQSDVLSYINQKDGRGRTPLMAALEQSVSDQSLVPAYLLGQGAKVDLCDSANRHTLIYAVWRNHVAIVEQLLDTFSMQASLNVQDDQQRSLWHHLAQDTAPVWGKNMLAMLQKPGIKMRFSYDLKDHKGRTPLHCAAVTGRMDVVDILFDNNVDACATEHKKKTALHLAAESGRVGIVEKLLARGASVQLGDAFGWTPLHYACLNRPHAAAMVSLLLEQDSQLTCNHATTSDGKTPLHLACESGNVDVVRMLLDTLRQNKEGHNPLLATAMSRQDKQGNTPLLAAALCGHRGVAELLAPWTQAHVVSLSQEAQRAAKGFKATVVDFNMEQDLRARSLPDIIEVPVFDMLYSNPELRQRFSTIPKQEGTKDSRTVRWIHLPANNIT